MLGTTQGTFTPSPVSQNLHRISVTASEEPEVREASLVGPGSNNVCLGLLLDRSVRSAVYPLDCATSVSKFLSFGRKIYQ